MNSMKATIVRTIRVERTRPKTRRWEVKTRQKGSVHKVPHARGEGVREGVTVCDRGGGSRAYDVTLLIFFYLTY